MKRANHLVLPAIVVAVLSFLTGGWLFSKRVLDEYNEMAIDNFSTALVVFRDDYQIKRVRIFGETGEQSTFVIDDFEFVLLPTASDQSEDPKKPRTTNIEAHLNGMAIMLASSWVTSADPRGEALLAKLKQVIPNHPLSAPNIESVSLSELEIGGKMMKAEADRWNGQMVGIR